MTNVSDPALSPEARPHDLPAPAATVPFATGRTGLLTGLAAAMVIAILVSTVVLSLRHERSLRQEAVVRAAESAAASMRSHLAASEVRIGLLASELYEVMVSEPQTSMARPREHFMQSGRRLLADEPAILRLEWRQEDGTLIAAVSAMAPRPRLDGDERQQPGFEAMVALRSAIQFDRPLYARPYYIVQDPLPGFEVTELVMPIDTKPVQALTAVFSMPLLLDNALPDAVLRKHQIMLTELDGTFVARSSILARGAGVYRASFPLELPGVSLRLNANSTQDLPSLIPNLLTAMLVAMTLGLTVAGMLLWRDTRLRSKAERELRDQHAFRKAMEDSLLTGLRARDMDGRITYVNPAFCRMTGYDATELIGRLPPMPYWTEQRILDGPPRRDPTRGDAMRLGYETEFVRRNGEPFPALIFEAPLIDEQGRQTGWMASFLDLTEQRRVEALNRLQQEKLQANARLALLGEVATALSHELNQPLAAIASYAAASENLLQRNGTQDTIRDSGLPVGALLTALSRIHGQSERAGEVVRSVQAFVGRRQVDRSPIEVGVLITSIEPLIRLQARRSGCTFRWHADPAAWVNGDRTMLEQVLLNLTRNAFEAMEQVPMTVRLAEIEVSLGTPSDDHPGGDAPAPAAGTVRIEVRDRGSGIAAEIVPQLFQAFVTSKPDGLGIGLSLCRSVAEAHGGNLRHQPRPGGGSIFVLELPACAPESHSSTREERR
ncbi:MAG: ATP-binding protein [Burkholderiaceae bacterium]